MARVDDLLARNLGTSKSAVGRLLEAGRITTLAGEVVTDRKADTATLGESGAGLPSVLVDGKRVELFEVALVLLNKPIGVVTALRDARHATAFSLLEDAPLASLLRPVGRLDLDTTGLLLWTTEGALIQRLTHPKRRVPRVYQAALAEPFATVPPDLTLEDGYRPEIQELSELAREAAHPALVSPPGRKGAGDHHRHRRGVSRGTSHLRGARQPRRGPVPCPLRTVRAALGSARWWLAIASGARHSVRSPLSRRSGIRRTVVRQWAERQASSRTGSTIRMAAALVLTALLSACGHDPSGRPRDLRAFLLAFDDNRPSATLTFPTLTYETLVRFALPPGSHRPWRLWLMAASAGTVTVSLYKNTVLEAPGDPFDTFTREIVAQEVSTGKDGRWIVEDLQDLDAIDGVIWVGVRKVGRRPGALDQQHPRPDLPPRPQSLARCRHPPRQEDSPRSPGAGPGGPAENPEGDADSQSCQDLRAGGRLAVASREGCRSHPCAGPTKGYINISSREGRALVLRSSSHSIASTAPARRCGCLASGRRSQ